MKIATAVVVAVALSTAALAQVGTEPVENKLPASPPLAERGSPTDAASPSTDDAPPSDRVDAPANVAPAPGYPTSASEPPPKR